MNFDSSVLNVAIEEIVPNRSQPRLVFDDASLSDLAKSIKEHGIIQPLVLRKFGDKYEIVAGERRFRAAKMAGLVSVPAVIALIDDKTSAEVSVAENVQRKQLTAIEEAKSYKALLDLGYMSVEQLANKMGVSAVSLDAKLKLLNLPAEVQDGIMDNRISERHARSLLNLPDTDTQIKWYHRIIDERLTVRMLDEKIKEEYKGDLNIWLKLKKLKEKFNKPNGFIEFYYWPISEDPEVDDLTLDIFLGLYNSVDDLLDNGNIDGIPLREILVSEKTCILSII